MRPTKERLLVHSTLGESLVLKMCEDYYGTRRMIVFDNFFTSIRVMTRLKENNLYAVGTVRTNKRGLPEMMKRKDNF